MVKRIDERHEFRHTLSNNPTDYERFVNYVESLILACENVTNAAEVYLRRVEDNEDFYNDPSNERWYDYDEKTEKVAKMIKQLEKMKTTILNRIPWKY